VTPPATPRTRSEWLQQFRTEAGRQAFRDLEASARPLTTEGNAQHILAIEAEAAPGLREAVNKALNLHALNQCGEADEVLEAALAASPAPAALDVDRLARALHEGAIDNGAPLCTTYQEGQPPESWRYCSRAPHERHAAAIAAAYAGTPGGAE